MVVDSPDDVVTLSGLLARMNDVGFALFELLSTCLFAGRDWENERPLELLCSESLSESVSVESRDSEPEDPPW